MGYSSTGLEIPRMFLEEQRLEFGMVGITGAIHCSPDGLAVLVLRNFPCRFPVAIDSIQRPLHRGISLWALSLKPRRAQHRITVQAALRTISTNQKKPILFQQQQKARSMREHGKTHMTPRRVRGSLTLS